MKRCLLDTGIMGDFLNARRGVRERAYEERKSGVIIGTCVPVVGELFFGVEASATRDENRKRLQRGLSNIICWPFDLRAAEEFGRISAELRRRGRPMQQIDVQIAAIALSLGNCCVVTSDSDLSAIAGLTVENWAQT